MNIVPLGNRVLVELSKQPEKLQSGLYIPETSKLQTQQDGTVIAVGDDEKINLKVGDKVILGQFAGVKMNRASIEYVLVKYEDVLAKFVE